MKMSQSNMLKIYLPDETFWARIIEDDANKHYLIGIVSNVLISDFYQLGDKITISRNDHSVLGLLQKGDLVKHVISYPIGDSRIALSVVNA